LVGGWNAFTISNIGSMLVLVVVEITNIIAIAFVADKAVGYTTRWKLRHGGTRVIIALMVNHL
jgi:hypothetical protein